MTSCIIPFRATKRQARLHGDAMKSAIAQAAMETFDGVAPELMQDALRAANRIIDLGGNFINAMDAIERIVRVSVY